VVTYLLDPKVIQQNTVQEYRKTKSLGGWKGGIFLGDWINAYGMKQKRCQFIHFGFTTNTHFPEIQCALPFPPTTSSWLELSLLNTWHTFSHLKGYLVNCLEHFFLLFFCLQIMFPRFNLHCFKFYFYSLAVETLFFSLLCLQRVNSTNFVRDQEIPNQ
jgi:hypothetical protein